MLDGGDGCATFFSTFAIVFSKRLSRLSRTTRRSSSFNAPFSFAATDDPDDFFPFDVLPFLGLVVADPGRLEFPCLEAAFLLLT